jgi:nucleotide-binding universal stress UspA family protein
VTPPTQLRHNLDHYARLPPTPDGDEQEATARTCLTAAADLARRHLPPARVMTELADGLPARALLNRATGAEMLVLGTDRPALHPAGHPRDVIGAIARACLSKAPCPVVIVAPGDFPPLPDQTCTESSHRAPRQYMPAAPDGALGARLIARRACQDPAIGAASRSRLRSTEAQAGRVAIYLRGREFWSGGVAR